MSERTLAGEVAFEAYRAARKGLITGAFIAGGPLGGLAMYLGLNAPFFISLLDDKKPEKK